MAALQAANALGMVKPTNVRTRIKGMLIDLKKLGDVALVECNVPSANGAPKRATAYYLNEEQATLLVMASMTLKAREVKLQIVRVFTAWRRGQLQPIQTGTGSGDLIGEVRGRLFRLLHLAPAAHHSGPEKDQ